ncbi:MAG: sigma-70 family RNA polymerase sigma factor, partial [Gemmataceae bacterium]|nr:sigma-70 family RNA polymerase sigma factor [Gemmataceae bacterium]
TIVARRCAVKEMVRRAEAAGGKPVETSDLRRPGTELESLEEVAKLLRKLPSRERSLVRLHYLEGRSYEEISELLNVPVNSIGPMLTRARKRLSQLRK